MALQKWKIITIEITNKIMTVKNIMTSAESRWTFFSVRLLIFSFLYIITIIYLFFSFIVFFFKLLFNFLKTSTMNGFTKWRSMLLANAVFFRIEEKKTCLRIYLFIHVPHEYHKYVLQKESTHSTSTTTTTNNNQIVLKKRLISQDGL